MRELQVASTEQFTTPGYQIDLSTMLDDHAFGRYFGRIELGGACFHVEAIEVELGPDEYCSADTPPSAWRQRAVSESMRDYFRELCMAIEADGDLETIEHNGRKYALFIYPFSE